MGSMFRELWLLLSAHYWRRSPRFGNQAEARGRRSKFMQCNCGGATRDSNHRTQDGRFHEVKTCNGCGRRYVEVRDKDGKLIERRG